MTTSLQVIVPNLFLVGPPKTGTSSLFRWLTAHPLVCGSLRKETFYLMGRTHPLCSTPNIDEEGWQGYAKLFPRDAGLYPIRIEGTTHYFYHDNALRRIAEIPDSRVCIVLRDPAERVLSSFEFTKNNLAFIPRDVTFDQFLDYVLSGRPLYPDICINLSSAYVLARDIAIGEYVRYLREWRHSLGRDRVHWLLFEDLKHHPDNVANKILKIMGAPPLQQANETLQRYNKTYSVRFQRLHRFVRQMNQKLPVSQRFKPLLKKVYLRFQGGARRTEAPPQAALERLRFHYEPYNRELETLLSVDLGAWMPSVGQTRSGRDVRHGT